MSTQLPAPPGEPNDLRSRAAYYRQRMGRRVSQWRDVLHDPSQQNNVHFYGDVFWYGIANGILGTFVTVFAIRLGASDALIGLLSSLPALVNIFWQVPSARLVERSGSIRRVTSFSLLAQRIFYLLIALMPFVLLKYRAEAVVALITLSALPGAVGGVAFTTLLARSVTAEKRGNLVGVRNMFLSLTSMLSVLAAGRLLDLIKFPYNYQIIFAVSFLATMLSLWHVNKVKPLADPPPRRSATPAGQPTANGEASAIVAVAKPSLIERLRGIWAEMSAEKAFMNFTWGSFIFNWSMYFPMALYTLYQVNALGASDTWLGLLSMVTNAVQIVMFMVWGPVMKKRGNRWMVLFGAFGLAGYPLFTGLATRVEPLLIPAAWSGFVGSAYSIATFDALISVCPNDRLPTFTAVYNTLANVTAFIGPLLGITVAGWIGLRYALLLSAALRFLGAFVLSRLEFGTRMPPSGRPGPFDIIKTKADSLLHKRAQPTSSEG